MPHHHKHKGFLSLLSGSGGGGHHKHHHSGSSSTASSSSSAGHHKHHHSGSSSTASSSSSAGHHKHHHSVSSSSSSSSSHEAKNITPTPAQATPAPQAAPTNSAPHKHHSTGAEIATQEANAFRTMGLMGAVTGDNQTARLGYQMAAFEDIQAGNSFSAAVDLMVASSYASKPKPKTQTTVHIHGDQPTAVTRQATSDTVVVTTSMPLPSAPAIDCRPSLLQSAQPTAWRPTPTYKFKRELNQKIKSLGDACGCFSLFGYSKQEKIQACNKMLSALNGHSVKFTHTDIGALRNKRLGEIVSRYEQVLPQSFIDAETAMHERARNITSMQTPTMGWHS